MGFSKMWERADITVGTVLCEINKSFASLKR